MIDFEYPGSELDLFETVRNWKSYRASRVRPFVRGDVLEVGAGLGANTSYLDAGGSRRWVCLEPDSALTARLTSNLGSLRACYEVLCGTLESVGAGQQFDSIAYIDVLEHRTP